MAALETLFIMNWLKAHFSWNPGWHEKVPFKFKGKWLQMIHIDTEYNEQGITRFQGIMVKVKPIVTTTLNPDFKKKGDVYSSIHADYDVDDIYIPGDEPIIPFGLIQLASHCGPVHVYPELNNAICWTLWFNPPLTKEAFDSVINK